MSKRIELPEPDANGWYWWDDAEGYCVITSPVYLGPTSLTRLYAGKFCASHPGSFPAEGKKAYHDTAEAAAEWLASRGYGPPQPA